MFREGRSQKWLRLFSFSVISSDRMNELHPLRSSWNAGLMILKGRLTDRKIDEYRRRGFYSADFREKRREIQQRKAARRARREGNFVVDNRGAAIYSPV